MKFKFNVALSNFKYVRLIHRNLAMFLEGGSKMSIFILKLNTQVSLLLNCLVKKYINTLTTSPSQCSNNGSLNASLKRFISNCTSTIGDIYVRCFLSCVRPVLGFSFSFGPHSLGTIVQSLVLYCVEVFRRELISVGEKLFNVSLLLIVKSALLDYGVKFVRFLAVNVYVDSIENTDFYIYNVLLCEPPFISVVWRV